MNVREMAEELSKPLPKAALKQHPTKTYLTSIKPIYVTERLNEVFGVGKWSQRVKTEYSNPESGMVVVLVVFEVPELGIYYESFGGNDNGGSGSKGFDFGDAYKGATTDALTKICSYLGIGSEVFKGEAEVKLPQNKKQGSTKWINFGDNAWNDAVSKKVPIEKVKQHYSISKENEAKYLEAIK